MDFTIAGTFCQTRVVDVFFFLLKTNRPRSTLRNHLTVDSMVVLATPVFVLLTVFHKSHCKFPPGFL